MKKEIKAQELTDPEIEDLDLEMDSIPDAQAADTDNDRRLLCLPPDEMESGYKARED